MSNNLKGLRLIITIVDRKKGKDVIKLYEKLGCTSHNTFLGNGTAPKEIFDFLGFGVIEKDVVLSIADEVIVPFMFSSLEDELEFNEPGKGIACSIPIAAVGGKRALDAILGLYKPERN